MAVTILRLLGNCRETEDIGQEVFLDLISPFQILEAIYSVLLILQELNSIYRRTKLRKDEGKTYFFLITG